MSNEQNFKRWIYHETQKPKIILNSEFEIYEGDGWADSPAKFAQIKDFGVDAEDPNSVQVLGESIEGVKDRINCELNIGKMDKEQLHDYALVHHSVTLDLNRGVRELRKEVKGLVGE
jgi:hypothetical protein